MPKFENNLIYYVILNKKDIVIDNSYNFNFVPNSKDETKSAYTILFKMLDYFKLPRFKIAFNENGKPYFENSNLYFNYSHSKNFLICALASDDVGVDIEENRQISDIIAKRYLNSAYENQERLNLWVKKEAYSKLYGIGFKINFSKIDLDILSQKEKLFISNNNYTCAILSSSGTCKCLNSKIK